MEALGVALGTPTLSLKKLVLNDNVDITDYDIKTQLLPAIASNSTLRDVQISGTKATEAMLRKVEDMFSRRVTLL
jgi:hypothetical protein